MYLRHMISNPVIIKLKVSWYSESYWGVLVIVIVAVCLFVCFIEVYSVLSFAWNMMDRADPASGV